MRDFLPDEKARREAVLASIRSSFAAFGYREIETPAAEELGRLLGGDSGDNAKLIFRILRRGLDPDRAIPPADAADLGLRYDLTVPLARFYASHRSELPAVFRAVQVAPVWRAERPQRGRYRQFTQCDIDVLGEASSLAEVELIVATASAVMALGLSGTTVRLNDRSVLTALLDWCGLPAAAHPAALVSVDKLDKVGLDGVAAELAGHDLPPPATDRLVSSLASLQGAGGELGAVLDALPAPAAAAAGTLGEIVAGVAEADPEVCLRVDPTLVRGQGYYTGPIFELHHPDSPSSIGGGGRYDGMIGRMAGVDVPACGFSIGFERVVELVDPARFARAAQRVALVHGADAPPGRVVAWQRRLVAGGAEVRLVPRARNLGRLLDQLGAEGFERWASVDATTSAPGVAELELRPLRR